MLCDAAEQLVQRLGIGEQVEIVGNDGGRGGAQVAAVVKLLLLLWLPSKHGLPQRQLQVRYAHDLRIGVSRLNRLGGLTDKILQNGHHFLVLEEGLAAGLRLLLRCQQYHQSRLSIRIDCQLLLLLLLASCQLLLPSYQLFLPSCQLLLCLQVRGAARLDGLDLCLDYVLEILSN